MGCWVLGVGYRFIILMLGNISNNKVTESWNSLFNHLVMSYVYCVLLQLTFHANVIVCSFS